MQKSLIKLNLFKMALKFIGKSKINVFENIP